VGNLYDTIIFIATASVVFLMVFEWFTRRGFALALAPVAGMALILLSRMFEVGDAKDHMDPLVAVLASNFWLTIHVITITLGYAGGLLTALFGAIYILLRGLGLDAGSADLRRMLTRATYGCVCLTLFLSLTGTVLGGIWANYSWGRFWGWDPKENGALLIVLWNLAVLHARMGGIIREWGLHLAAVFGSTIVVFSWWHVNFLNVGLHTYGFTSGKGVIWMIYLVVALFLAFGFVARELERRRARAS
jgi:ABC-type transport system involved in cytochrome c biogenesis permease subunit